jgi:hypothetical protein
MKIPFNVGPRACEYSRNWFTGGARITVDGQSFKLQSVLNPTNYIDLKLTRAWSGTVDGHLVQIVKKRPVLFAGFRPHSYTVYVDGVPLLTTSGF